MNDFDVNMDLIRKEAEHGISQGAIVSTYKANRVEIIQMLDQALAAEWMCALRYLQNAYAIDGIYAGSIVHEFKKHAAEEQKHAQWLSARILQLGGFVNLNPATFLERSKMPFLSGHSVAEMIKENLVAERMAIEIYDKMIRFVGDSDPTTRRILEDILKEEEDHACELAVFIPAGNKRHDAASQSSAIGSIEVH